MKKIISLFLALSIICVGAVTSVSADTPTKDASVLLGALNITDGTEAEHISAGENLTRAAAIYYALRVTNHNDPGTPSQYSFGDVTSTTPYAAYIEYATSLGIISQDTEYRPNDDVTIGEFLKMVEVGLGYKVVASMLGDYASGYVSLGSRLGILSGVDQNPNDTIPYASLQKYLSNVLMSSYAEMTGDGSFEADSKENVLYKVFDVYKMTGVMTANAVTSLNSTTGAGKGKVGFGDEVYAVRDDVYPSLSKELGAKLNAWVHDPDDGTDVEIICFEEHSDTDVIEIFSEDFDEYSGTTITYSPNNHTKTITVPSSANVIYNGKATTTPITGDVFNGKWGSIRLVKPTGKDVETMVITAYENFYVSGVNKDTFTVFDNTTNNHSISFKDNNDDLSENAVFTLKGGNSASFADVKAGVVLSVATPRAIDSASDDAEDTYYDIIITNEQVSGVLKGVTKTDGELPVANIDGNDYKLAPEMDDSRIAEIQAGNTYTFYLDAGGRIAAGILTASLSNELDWVFLIDILEDYNSGDDCLYFKVLTRTGNVLSLRNAERVKIDGKVYKDTNLKAIKHVFENSLYTVRSQVVRIGINDDSELTTVDTIALGENENDTDNVHQIRDTILANPSDSSDKVYYKKNYLSFGNEFSMNSKTTVFCLPSTFDPDSADKGDVSDYAAFSLGTMDLWENDTASYTVTPYNTDKHSQVASVVTYLTSGKSGMPIENCENLFVVTDICRIVNDDNETVTQIKGLQSGSDYTKEVAEGVDVGDIAKGDAIIYGLDFDGNINAVQKIYDCSTTEFTLPTSSASEFGMGRSKRMMSMAKAYRVESGFLTFTVNRDTSKAKIVDDVRDLDPSDANAKRLITKLSYRFVLVEIDGKNVTVSKTTSSAIKDWYNYGQDASLMLIHNRYEDPYTLVIYDYKD